MTALAELVYMNEVEPTAIHWLWRDRIPRGRITLLCGKPGDGKSFLTMDLAARVSTGTPWPDGATCDRADVLLIVAEDDPGDTVRVRLDSCGADTSRVVLSKGVRHQNPETGRDELRMFDLRDIAKLRGWLAAMDNPGLVIIDPIGSFIGGRTDSHRDNEVRSILAPVAELAREFNVAVLLVVHHRKSAGTSADDMAMGSRAFVGLARAAWHVVRDQADHARRLFLPGKNNLAREGHGMAFRIGGDPASIRWERDAVEMRADDAMAEASRPGPEPDARKAAETWLGDLLANGPVLTDEVKDSAKQAGISWITIRRASERLEVVKERCPYSEHKKYQWRLPKPGCSGDPQHREPEQREQTV